MAWVSLPLLSGSGEVVLIQTRRITSDLVLNTPGFPSMLSLHELEGALPLQTDT